MTNVECRPHPSISKPVARTPIGAATGMLAVLSPLLKQAKGFIAHGAGPSGDRWRSFEIWESQEDATQFFAKYIHPNLPEGVKPTRSILELHSLIKI